MQAWTENRLYELTNIGKVQNGHGIVGFHAQSSLNVQNGHRIVGFHAQNCQLKVIRRVRF